MIKMLKRTNYNNTYYVTDQEYSLPPEIEARWCRNGLAEAVESDPPKGEPPSEKQPEEKQPEEKQPEEKPEEKQPPKKELAREGLPPKEK